MKKIILLIMILAIGFVLYGCDNDDVTPKELEIVYEEEELSFKYFWETSNSDKTSDGYGLSRDRYSGNPKIASIAAVGFSLASIPAGVENGWITKEEGYERALGTLNTLLKLERKEGFYFHFINMQTGKREWDSEVSIIDTGLLVAGAIVAGEYFQGEVLEKATEIYDGIKWSFYVDNNKKMFYMGYSPESGPSGSWDHIAEQLILYVLAAGAPTYYTNDSLYRKMKDVSESTYKGTYKSTLNPELSVTTPFYYTFNGSLFQYQFSHAFIDFRNIVDADGTNWHENSVLATKAHYAYVQDQSGNYLTYDKDSWGLSAGDGPGEYNAYGGKPSKSNKHNGTVAPYAAIASINFLEKESIAAANKFKTYDQLWGDYGFKDSFNLGPAIPSYNPSVAGKTPWYASDYIGIDKGITLLMIENYRSELIWKYFMQNEYVQDGLERLGFSKA
ncbi:MAG: glucoamylase family protein [Acholeplasma sp.]|nr:glucoamylase family protein [Acholeplasma sp.]